MDTSKDQPTAAAVAARDITDRKHNSEEDEEESISSSSSNTEGKDSQLGAKGVVRHHAESQKEMPHGSLPLDY
jgi:hypothetical protein